MHAVIPSFIDTKAEEGKWLVNPVHLLVALLEMIFH
jgi:hypothetical protein